MFLLFMLSTLSSASTTFGWLPQMLSAVSTPQISCESQDDNSLKQRCAQELCGLPGSVESVFVRDGALTGFTPSPEAQAEVDRVQREMDRVTSQWKQKAEAFVLNSETKLSQTTQIDPRQVSGIETIFSDYVSYSVEGERIKVRTSFPNDIDPVVRAGVVEWSQNREQAVQADSILRLQLGLDPIDETLVTMRERARIVRETLRRPEYAGQLSLQQLTQLKQSLGQLDQALSFPMPPLEILSNIDKFLERIENAFELAPAGQLNPSDTPFESEQTSATDPLCAQQCLQALAKLVTKDALGKKITTIKKRLN